MWYKKYLKVYNKKFENTPIEIIEEIRCKLDKLQNANPLVTVSIIAYNEEKHLLACLWSLCDMKYSYPIEIIGVDNDSTDNSAEIFKACGVRYYTEKQHSCGFARQCGLNAAKGKYHINIDADTMYPPHYVEILVKKLEQPNIVAVSSFWSYIPDKSHPKYSLLFYETIRDLFLLIQSIKRPELSVRGLVFAYSTQYAKEIGIRTDIIRGEDGYLALKLKKYGKIAFIYNHRSRAVTGYGTIDKDGSFFNSFKRRVLYGIKNIEHLFTKKVDYKDKDNNLVK